jgi:hypothetical protein
MEPMRPRVDGDTSGEHIGACAAADPVRGVEDRHLRPRAELAGRDQGIDALADGDGSAQARYASTDDDDVGTHGDNHRLKE